MRLIIDTTKLPQDIKAVIDDLIFKLNQNSILSEEKITTNNLEIPQTATTNSLVTTNIKVSQNPNADYVLTSDTDGNGTWKAIYDLVSFPPKPPGINDYVVPYIVNGVALTILTLTSGRTYWIPLMVNKKVQLTEIAINVTTASAGTHYVGIYASNDNLEPTGSVLVSASFDTGSTGVKTSATNYTLQKGIYWIAWVAGSGATVRAVATGGAYPLSVANLGTVVTTSYYTSGSTLPSPAPTTGYSSLTGSVPAVGMKYNFA